MAQQQTPEEPRSSRDKVWKTFRRVACILAFAALIMVCSNIGQEIPNSLSPLAFKGPNSADSNEQGMVVADDNGKRLLFLDENREVADVVRIDNGEAPISEINYVATYGDDVYVAGFSCDVDGENIISESVLHYDLQSGDYLGRIWEKKYKANSVVVAPRVSDITLSDEGMVQITQLESPDNSVVFRGTKVEEVDENGDKSEVKPSQAPQDEVYLFMALYLSSKGACLVSDTDGELFLETRATSGGNATQFTPLAATQGKEGYKCMAVQNDELVLHNCRDHTILHIDKFLGEATTRTLDTDVLCKDININGSLVTATLYSDELRIYDLSTGETHSVVEAKLSPALLARSVAFYVSLIYLILFSCSLVIILLVQALRQGLRSNVRIMILSIAIALICFAAMRVHAQQVFNASFDARLNSLQQIASYLSYTSPRTIGDAANRQAARLTGELGEEGELSDSKSLYKEMESVLLSSFKSKMGVHCGFFSVSDSGEVQHLVTNQQLTLVGDPLDDAVLAEAMVDIVGEARSCKGDGVQRVRELMDKGMAKQVKHVYNGGNLAAVIAPIIATDGTCRVAVEVAFHYESFMQQKQYAFLFSLFSFAMVAVSIYILAKELIVYGWVYLRFWQERKRDTESAAPLMGRPMLFITRTATGMDAALAVIIAREMLKQQGMANDAFAWGLPAIALTLGATVGNLLVGELGHRIPIRKLALSFAIAFIAAQVACGIAAVFGLFPLFIAGKFVASACGAAIAEVATTLAAKTIGRDYGDGELSFSVHTSATAIAGRGGQVIAGVAGGYIAFMLGNQYLYFVTAILGMVNLVIFFLALPKDGCIVAGDEEANVGNIGKFLVSPTMLYTLAFSIFPLVLAEGYKSYLMPLFLDSAGVSKADISCYFSLGNAVLYLLMEPLIKKRDSIDRQRTSWMSLVGLGITFLLYSFNQAPVWCVISVVAITLLTWLAGDWKRNSRIWAKQDFGFNRIQANSFLTTENTMVKNLQQPVLQGLLLLGGPVCCLVLGVFFSVSGVVTRRTIGRRSKA
ncbi:MAG: MFS transporter [Coriobacteriales bacterium]|nr:MFS transporter [Coriobacteriales bacterium]